MNLNPENYARGLLNRMNGDNPLSREHYWPAGIEEANNLVAVGGSFGCKRYMPPTHYLPWEPDVYAPAVLPSLRFGSQVPYAKGTSIATPVVTSVLAILKSIHPAMTASELRLQYILNVMIPNERGERPADYRPIFLDMYYPIMTKLVRYNETPAEIRRILRDLPADVLAQQPYGIQAADQSTSVLNRLCRRGGQVGFGGTSFPLTGEAFAEGELENELREYGDAAFDFSDGLSFEFEARRRTWNGNLNEGFGANEIVRVDYRSPDQPFRVGGSYAFRDGEGFAGFSYDVGALGKGGELDSDGSATLTCNSCEIAQHIEAFDSNPESISLLTFVSGSLAANVRTTEEVYPYPYFDDVDNCMLGREDSEKDRCFYEVDRCNRCMEECTDPTGILPRCEQCNPICDGRIYSEGRGSITINFDSAVVGGATDNNEVHDYLERNCERGDPIYSNPGVQAADSAFFRQDCLDGVYFIESADCPEGSEYTPYFEVVEREEPGSSNIFFDSYNDGAEETRCNHPEIGPVAVSDSFNATNVVFDCSDGAVSDKTVNSVTFSYDGIRGICTMTREVTSYIEDAAPGVRHFPLGCRIVYSTDPAIGR